MRRALLVLTLTLLATIPLVSTVVVLPLFV
jgi:hypothetical protein